MLIVGSAWYSARLGFAVGLIEYIGGGVCIGRMPSLKQNGYMMSICHLLQLVLPIGTEEQFSLG